MRLELFAAGSMDDFVGPVKRTELRESLSEGIGVPVEKIALSVEAASVRLHFSVSVEAEASITLVAEIKAALPSATAASAMLGVEVLRTPLLTLDLAHNTHLEEPSLLRLISRRHAVGARRR